MNRTQYLRAKRDGAAPVAGPRIRDPKRSYARFEAFRPGDTTAKPLANDHPAVVEGRSVFNVTRPSKLGNHVLISGINQSKIGHRIVKGPWSGLPVYTLSLEERATCPRSCKVWAGCLTPDARVLTAELKWEPLADLRVGQMIAGFDEDAPHPKQRMTKLATVEKLKRAIKPCYRITTDQGTVIASDDHLWLRRRSRLHYKWYRTDDLKIGDRLQYFWKPWEEDRSYEAGRLRGFVEGEGTCGTTRRKGHPQAKSRMGWSQRPTALCQEIIEVARRLGFKTARYERIAGVNRSAVSHIDIRGGWRAVAEFLGRIRPTRMIEKAADIWTSHSIGGRGGKFATVLKIEDVGDREVMMIETSTGTMVAEGFFTHNCYGNAMPFAARWSHGPEFERALLADLFFVAGRHRGNGFAVRIHVLGDFYSTGYVSLWREALAAIPNLRVWGYTAWPRKSEMGRVVEALNAEFPDRWAVRFSGSETIVIARREERGGAIICPAETGATANCGSCGLCFAPTARNKVIAFLFHGNPGRGRPRKAA